MAQFNPAIQPTNDPNYENRSRPVDIPDSIRPRGAEPNQIMPKGQEVGDRSAEYLGKAAGYAAEAAGSETKGYGDLFAGIVGIGDFMGKAGVSMVKKDIEDKVYSIANQEREIETRRLENLKAAGGTKNLLDANAQMTDEVPEEITELPNTLGVLKSAANGGRLSKTDYNGRLLAAAKDLRTRYPGFKPEIDEEFSKVTGVNPANAYITGLITDINRMAASQNSEQNKLLTFIRSNSGVRGADGITAEEAYQKVQTGEWSGPNVVRWIAPHERFRMNLADKAAVFNDRTLSDADRKRAGEGLLDTAITEISTKRVDTFLRENGLNSVDDAIKAKDMSQNGYISPTQWNEIGRKWNIDQLNLRNAMVNDARKAGLIEALGFPAVNARIDAAMKMHDEIGKAIFAKDTGGIFDAARDIKALGDQDQKNILKDSLVGADFRSIEVIKRIGGDQFLQNENLRKLTDGLSGRFEQYQKRMIRAMESQTNGTNPGEPVTLTRALDDIKVKMKDATDGEKRKMVASVFNEVARITDPNVPENIRANLARAAFHEENIGVISRLNVDAKDARGNQLQGQNAIFQKLTSEDMTKEMRRLGNREPAIWDNYVRWTSETLGKELVKREILGLNEIRNPAIKVGWDSDNKRLEVSYQGQTDTSRARPGLMGGATSTTSNPATDTEYGMVQSAVSRINSNLSNFKRVAEASGQNVEAFMLGNIVKVVGAEALSKVDNIPGDIMRQIGLTQLKKK